MDKKIIPVFRIFDYAKAIEFYIDWLGFRIDWEDREEGRPIYMQVTLRDYITLHLTEHHGDCCPGAKAFVLFDQIKDFHALLLAKNYKYNRPGIEEAAWNATIMTVIDPFGNQLLFNEYRT